MLFKGCSLLALLAVFATVLSSSEGAAPHGNEVAQDEFSQLGEQLNQVLEQPAVPEDDIPISGIKTALNNSGKRQRKLILTLAVALGALVAVGLSAVGYKYYTGAEGVNPLKWFSKGSTQRKPEAGNNPESEDIGGSHS